MGMMSSFLRTSKYQEKANEKAFVIRNGKVLLEELIASSNGKYNPIRSFSPKELRTATNNYNHWNIITEGFEYKLYRGFLQDRPISVMKYVKNGCFYEQKDWINNIVFASQMSHKNVLKLIGCCLKAEIPVLVFESIEYKTLDHLLFGHSEFNFERLLLKHRLKIAMEIANVIAYLHIGFSRPIAFRDLTSKHIVFCEEYVPKLYNFSLAASIPEGETHVEDVVRGTCGFAAPEYVSTGFFNEKCDVYSFGAVLFELLTGEELFNVVRRPEMQYIYGGSMKKYIENNGFEGIVDPGIIGDEPLEQQQQLRASLELALKCFSELEEDRPVMIDIAKQLRLMYQSTLTS
ncbi:putative Receptor protein kinase [Melia azedarach]|uniref:Receptor protein kinase n=1 Tax=Melia azedarach TaxID=155640 RepID=A0ACC1YCG2_MELAZ|nr:putative Receptor protein kinase [Melia azedarach]